MFAADLNWRRSSLVANVKGGCAAEVLNLQKKMHSFINISHFALDIIIRISYIKIMKTLQKAIQYFLRDLGINHYHVILGSGSDAIEFSSYTQHGAKYTEIVISFEKPEETSHLGECYNVSPFLVKVNPELSLLKQLIVLAHELKHVQEYVKTGETSEETAHKYDWRGAWLGLQCKLLTLQQYKQLVTA